MSQHEGAKAPTPTLVPEVRAVHRQLRTTAPALPPFAELRRDPETQRVIDTAVFHPRPEDEWQGMRVDVSRLPGCGRDDGCGLAMACIENQCSPCAHDIECTAGEVCVLDHCVLANRVDCRSAGDCWDDDELCVLTGYSGGPRGNESMSAICQSPHWADENEEVADEPAVPEDAEFMPRPISVPDLRDSLLEDLGLSPAEDPIRQR